jgi:hypothetical protein
MIDGPSGCLDDPVAGGPQLVDGVVEAHPRVGREEIDVRQVEVGHQGHVHASPWRCPRAPGRPRGRPTILPDS